MSTVLSVNLNKIALLRNSREGSTPDVCEFAKIAIEAGAKGITVHPRPDQRHIRPDDVYRLSDLLKKYDHIEFNIEGNPFEHACDGYPGFMALVEEVQPHQATLVPDDSSQLTSDHGFDLNKDSEKLGPIIKKLASLNIRTSLFMDPDTHQIKLAEALGADRIELYTGPYAESFSIGDHEKVLQQYKEAALYAQNHGLVVNAGHDLNLQNLATFLSIPNIAEVSIGHALTVEALTMGYQNTINDYRKICDLH